MFKIKILESILLIMFVLLPVVRAERIIVVDASVKFTEGKNKDEVYELLKLRVCQKALQELVRGAENMILRRYWDTLNPEQEILSEPHKYFIAVKVLQKLEMKKKLKIKAEVVIDDSAIASFIDRKAGAVAERLNAVGLSMLFLARAADKEVDYLQDSVSLEVKESERGEHEISSQQRVSQQTSFTTRVIDTTEILTNITSRLTDSGIRINSVQMLLPYIEESEKLRGYLHEVNRAYAGYTDESGIYRSGRTEEGIAYILSVIQKISEHSRYFALGKIDIGNTVYEKDKGVYRGSARCSITLWDLDAGVFPVKIATTPVISAYETGLDRKEAQKKAAEQAATDTGNEILNRIRSVMLEEFYRDKRNNEEKFELNELLGSVIIEVDEQQINSFTREVFTKKYAQAEKKYLQREYSEAFILFSTLAEQGYVPARNMTGYMYYTGEGIEQDTEKALGILSLGMEENNIDPEAAYYLALMYYNGIDGKVDYKLGRKLLAEAAGKGLQKAVNEIGHLYLKGIGVVQDYSEALKWFRRAQEGDSPEGVYNLGYMYEHGLGVREDIVKALGYYERAAELGYVLADYSLGKIYEGGLGVEQNLSKAFWYYQRAARKYNIMSWVRLAYMYAEGTFVEQSYSRAGEYFRKAAREGNAEAECALGIIYENGYGVERDYARALKHYRKAAASGHAYAYSCLGSMYQNGLGTEKNYHRAKEWFEKGVEQGDNKSRVDLAFLYMDGLGVAKSYKKAAELLRVAAESGNYIAEYNLGVFYEKGYGVGQNYAEAVKWYKRAVEHGHFTAANNLAMFYLGGYGIKVNYHEAKRLFELAAEGGYADAYGGLASLYRDGFGVKKNVYRAIGIYEEGAALGSSFCYLQLGVIFITGKHLPVDYPKAFDYCLRAAKLGNVQAMYLIGAMYHEGKGVGMNAAEAIKWYRRAADKGHIEALFILGNINEYGWFGVVVNYKDAVYWYRKAAELGHVKARERADALRYAY